MFKKLFVVAVFSFLLVLSVFCSKNENESLSLIKEETLKAEKLVSEYTSLPKITDGRTVSDQQTIREQRREKKAELQNQYEKIVAFGGNGNLKILQALYPRDSQASLEYLSKLNFISLINYAREVRSWSSWARSSLPDNTKKIKSLLAFIQSDVEQNAFASLVRNGLVAQLFLDEFKKDIKIWKPYIKKVTTEQQVKIIDKYYLSKATKNGEVGLFCNDKQISKEALKLLKITEWINSDVALDLIESLNFGAKILNAPESKEVKAFQRAIIQISELATEMVNPERSLKEFKLKIKQKIRSGIPIQEIEKVFIKTWDEIE
ncbi:hypothetical protein KKA66_03920 [Patescibacteria group bacterium]|nr:hypothetical protein [Patescibacteria group bacterium]